MSYNSDLLDRYVECYNARDLDGVMDLYAEDAVQIMPDGRYEGKEVIRARLAMELDACSDVQHTVRSFVEQDDAFCDEWTFRGTHTGPLALPDGSVIDPTGRPVEVNGMEIVRMNAGGKVILNALYYDNLALAVQVGLIPEATPA